MGEHTGVSRRRRRWRWFGVGVLLALLVLLADYLLYPLLPQRVGRSANTGSNGLWLRYTWYFGEWNDGDLAALAQRMQAGQVRDAYFHVRFITADGTLRFHHPEPARRLTAALHHAAPATRLFAWVYAGNLPGRNRVDLNDATVRRRMVAEAVQLVREYGFDGVQWDYEICRDGEQGLLALLRETRAALPTGTPISVCTPMWYPAGITRRYGWSEAYFAQVAALCDQLTVMGYDSAIYLPRGYVWLMRQQTVRVTRAVARGNPECRVLIGIPTYEKGGLSHHRRAENIRMALKGVRAGVADLPANDHTFAGVALFADYTTSQEEWQAYRELWLE